MLTSDSSASVTPMLDRLLRIFTATSVSRHLPRCTLPMLPSPICFFNTWSRRHRSQAVLEEVAIQPQLQA